jgi:UDP-N-acetylmuramoyl-tripeptide--D-alanyl-D-alanine ligase
MTNFNLLEVAKVVDGQFSSHFEMSALGIGTDTRKKLTGQLFIALKGESFDAHQFLKKAVEAGAAALLIHELPESQKDVLKKVTVIQVKDTLRALQALGQWVRRQRPARVLALTGSNGKTSTKEFTAQILSRYRSVCYSQGSFNNHWGVPLSLLEIEPKHETAIIEMGMNHKGEIEELVKIAEPDAVVCTMVGRAHIEFFGTQEKIAEAKQEIYLASRPKTLAIYNLDNSFTRKMYEQAVQTEPQRPKMTFSEKQNADVQLQLLEATFEGLRIKGSIRGFEGEVIVPIFGGHNITNLQAAAALALAAGLTPEQVWKGLENCKSHWGRNQKVKLKSGALALFDAYNANPDSMEALLNNVHDLHVKGRKIGVFGQMRELGEQSQYFHKIVGQKAGQGNFAKIFFYGTDYESFLEGVKSAGYSGDLYVQADFSDDFARLLKTSIEPQDLVIFKASRGPRLERMLEACEPLDFSLDKTS